MTRGYIGSTNLNKWLYQNQVIDLEDGVEGCLLDNFIARSKNGIIAVYEHYLNANSSDYYIEFARDKDNESCELLYKNWERFKSSIEDIEN